MLQVEVDGDAPENQNPVQCLMPGEPVIHTYLVPNFYNTIFFIFIYEHKQNSFHIFF